MAPKRLTFDDIDYFYYHSIDFDFARYFSIMKNGITSAQMATNLNLPYFHRNYKNASCKQEHISVSHFPRTFFSFHQLQNELYDSSLGKIVFVLDGRIKAVEKTAHKKRYEYTNERHVYNHIDIKDILGIAIREKYGFKNIGDIRFNLDLTDEDGQLKKCFDVVQFFRHEHDYFIESDLNYLVGCLIEEKTINSNYKKSEIYKSIKNQIENVMMQYINNAYQEVLNKDCVNLIDILELYNYQNKPIYLLGHADIVQYEKGVNPTLRKETKGQIDRKRAGITTNDSLYLRRKHRIEKKYLPSMSEEDLDIYYGYSNEPMSEKGVQIKQLILSEIDKIKYKSK